ncbi:MAG TPA: heavy metal translocating P-type ATPase [Erysipelotrichaceae bacterium]|nr:heavy metal translocating P-type ATPase [Erysipelotrichaceae bacterium]
MNKKQKKMLTRIILSAVLFSIMKLLKIESVLGSVIYLIPYFLIGYDVLIGAFKGLIAKVPFDENFLMAIATVGAIFLSDFNEAIAVMLFYQIGELFQSYAIGKSRKSITALMDIRPDYANIEQNGAFIKVDPYEVEVGTIITILPGEKVPLDGIIVEGRSVLDIAALTGESVPKEIDVADEVLSGSVNISGLLKVQTTKEFEQSTASRILNLVENASNLKSKSENFISRFARVYTPIVVYSALALASVIPLINLLTNSPVELSKWIYRALTFLVISCPCALVISIPLSFFAGIGAASSQGILIKGSNYLETLAKVKMLMLDKTGTLTKGVFAVNAIHHSEDDDNLVMLAAYGEYYSNHPIARGILEHYGKEIDEGRISEVKEIAGKGIVCRYQGKQLAVGNEKLMQQLMIDYQSCQSVGTIVHVSLENEYLGHLVISDVLKENTAAAIEQLKIIGVKEIYMLTGDNEKVAKDVAERVKIENYHYQLLPDDKLEIIKRIIKEKAENQKLAFVGDGINDAPALSIADVGIAMGALGTDAAIEAADVVLMDDDLLKLVKAIKISKTTLGIVYQNIIFAITVKVGSLILGAFGHADMWLAIFADVGVMVIAVLNAMRIMFLKNS